jgi:hypothetical protein
MSTWPSGDGCDDRVPGKQHNAEGEDEDEALRDSLQAPVSLSVEVARNWSEEDTAQLLAKATAAAGRVTAEAEAIRMEAKATRAAAEEMKVAVEQDRLGLQAEKASMEGSHTFQTTKIVLSVGGHRFETSRQTLTSVSGSYLASMFSGRCNTP